MNPILFDVSAYLAVTRSPVKAPLNDALGAEVKEIIGCQAADIPYQYSMGRVRDVSVFLPFYSEVIQSSRCTLMAKRLFGDVGVRLSGSWLDFKLENMNCKAAAWFVEAIDELFRGLLSLSGFDLNRTFISNFLESIKVIEE